SAGSTVIDTEQTWPLAAPTPVIVYRPFALDGRVTWRRSLPSALACLVNVTELAMWMFAPSKPLPVQVMSSLDAQVPGMQVTTAVPPAWMVLTSTLHGAPFVYSSAFAAMGAASRRPAVTTAAARILFSIVLTFPSADVR